MKTLIITELDFSKDGILSMSISSDDFADRLWFDLPTVVKPHNDLISTAIAATFGSKFDRYVSDIPLSEKALTFIIQATNAEWEAPVGSEQSNSDRRGVALNFSGGFDSLAALACLEDEATLISMDFGEKFERERKFFEGFDTRIVKSNVREFESCWTFMGVGSILLSGELNSKYVSFGSILEASAWNFVSPDKGFSTPAIFRAADLEIANPIVGLTEFGSALLAARRFPEEMTASLRSLADTHTEKYLRKFAIVEILNRDFGLNIELPSELPTLKTPVPFGESFAVDFLSAGFIHFAPESYQRWVSLRPSQLRWLESVDPEFYWFDNTEAFTYVDADLATSIYRNKLNLGILPYRYRHWKDFSKVLNLLSAFHTFPGPVL